MKEKDESRSSSQVAYDYYLADNESKMWDDKVAGGSLPEYNTLPPSTVDFGSLVEKSSLIKDIVPYYPMGFGIENKSSKVTFVSDSGSKEVVFPYQVSDSLTFQNIIFRPYTDESVFLSAVDVEKMNDVEDGAYITENILKKLGLNKCVHWN